MLAEGPLEVMVLAMNIACDCTADGYVLRSWRDGQEPTARDKQRKNVGEGDSSRTGQNTGCTIEAVEIIQLPGVDYARSQRTITVAASQSSRYKRFATAHSVSDF